MVQKKKSGLEKARKRLMRLALRQTHLYRFVNMEVPPRFELGVELLQSSALPLGYGTKPWSLCAPCNMERVTRLELATSTLARWRSTR